ncbi:MAG: DNA recombination protein RmuC [Bacteroidales bacterium]
MEFINVMLGAVIAVLLLLIFRLYLAYKLIATLKDSSAVLTNNNKELELENIKLTTELSLVKEQSERSRVESDRMRVEMQRDFKLIATDLLEQKGEQLTSINTKNITELLNPLNDRITEFKKRVEDTYDRESKQRFSLEEKIKDLVKLNEQMSMDAQNLTRALKGDSKVQGDWGEVILERILEQSGLTRNQEYYIQETLRSSSGELLKDEMGRVLRPDVVVRYPDNKVLIVDSKVSLAAYVRYLESVNDEERSINAKQHMGSVKSHIDQLSAKRYEMLDGSLEFKMLFMPNEGAYTLALQGDSSLWEYAYSKQILLISPTNLIAALKLIVSLWKQENQNRNVQAIAEAGANLYDKFAGFVESMQRIGGGIDRTKEEYDKAFAQLASGRGNIISRVEKMKELGLKTKKQLPSVNE